MQVCRITFTVYDGLPARMSKTARFCRAGKLWVKAGVGAFRRPSQPEPRAAEGGEA